MKGVELRKKNPDELKSLLKENLLRREELFILTHQKKFKNVKQLKMVKKEIARIKTILRESIEQSKSSGYWHRLGGK